MPEDRDAPWLNDAEMRGWRSFIAAMNLVHRALDRELRHSVDMTVDDYGVLVHLSEATDRRVRLGELAALLRVPKAHLTYRIQRMEKSGLLRRVGCDDDGRGVWAVMTPEGFERLKEAAPIHVASVRRHVLDHWDAAQLAAVGDAMEALLRGHDGCCAGDGTASAP